MIIDPTDIKYLFCDSCTVACYDVEFDGCGEPDTYVCDVCECYIEGKDIIISRYNSK